VAVARDYPMFSLPMTGSDFVERLGVASASS
jgi:hypothetical protein